MRLLLTSILFLSQFSISQEPIKIAIIGGGMAGVSAAHHILSLNENVEVTLLEKEGKLGGNARTIQLENSFGNLVSVDAGAQYFEDELWINYIAFLKTYNLYDENQVFAFSGSAVIENDLDEKPDFISPDGLKIRGGKFGDAMQFLKFYKAARKVYEGKVEYSPTVGAWVEELKLKDDFKKAVALPFLASTLACSVQQIKACTTKDVVKLFAAQKALKKSDFKVLARGMGFLIQDIGKQLEKNGVEIIRNAEVKSVVLHQGKLSVEYNEVERLFDFIVFAAHPYQVAKIMEKEPEFSNFTAVLNQFKYFQTSIVLHRDSSFIDSGRSSFMNVKTSKTTNSIVSSTMNLEVVNPEWKGLYKSWMTEKQLEFVKAKGLFIHQGTFNHTLMTPEFHSSLDTLKQYADKRSDIYFAGGWSEGLETQETATNSGKKAADKVKLFIESEKN
jgi:predicted NAD/FAD-binding protein